MVEQKTCPLCKHKFQCEDSPQCWCNEPQIQELVPRLKPYIKMITGCVCKECMVRLPPLKQIKKTKTRPIYRNPNDDVPQPSTYSG